MIKRIFCIILVVSFIGVLMAGCRKTETNPTDDFGKTSTSEKPYGALKITIKEIGKHGNVILNTSFDEMESVGIGIGDIITVKAGDKEYELPVGTAYTDVDSGKMICRLDIEDNEVALAINYGSFAEAAGLAEKQTTEEDPGYKWEIRVGEVILSLKEKGGYLNEYNARNLVRTDVRTDYPELSDEEFANFRAVTVSGLKENTLYRSSTPIEPALGRNGYAMAAMEKEGIKSVVNLDDSVETMKIYPTFPDSYYSLCAVINPEMGYDFESEEFAAKVKESVLFIAESDGPYLVHCKEGKDRTGILCAVLECFAGATADDVKRDYMITYYNYYGVKPEDAAYSIILNNNLVKTLSLLLGTDNFVATDLKAAARQYLISIGLSEEQLNKLAEKLVKD